MILILKCSIIIVIFIAVFFKIYLYWRLLWLVHNYDICISRSAELILSSLFILVQFQLWILKWTLVFFVFFQVFLWNEWSILMFLRWKNWIELIFKFTDLLQGIIRFSIVFEHCLLILYPLPIFLFITINQASFSQVILWSLVFIIWFIDLSSLLFCNFKLLMLFIFFSLFFKFHCLWRFYLFFFSLFWTLISFIILISLFHLTLVLHFTLVCHFNLTHFYIHLWRVIFVICYRWGLFLKNILHCCKTFCFSNT